MVPGSVQRYGDTVLALVKEVASELPAVAADPARFASIPTPCYLNLFGALASANLPKFDPLLLRGTISRACCEGQS